MSDETDALSDWGATAEAKDRYWNLVNPRGKFASITDDLDYETGMWL